MEMKKCGCCSSPALGYACSGGSDVGEITDRAVRLLAKMGVCKMSCAVGVGGGVPGLQRSAEAAARKFVVDGCPLECAKKSMEKAGISKFSYINLTEMGFEKGASEVSEENIRKVVDAVLEKVKC